MPTPRREPVLVVWFLIVLATLVCQVVAAVWRVISWPVRRLLK